MQTQVITNYDDPNKFEARCREVERIREKHPDRIPVLVKRGRSSDLPMVDKSKYLVPIDFTMGQFIFTIRKRIKLQPEKALFMFVNNTIPATSEMMSTIYDKYKSEDGFLRIEYTSENTFGAVVNIIIE